jgi:hypothetical protein
MATKDTYIPRNELIDLNKEFDRVRKQAEEELMKLPGVVAVGVGLKQVKGEMQGELCFKVTVSKKKEEDEIKPADRIPAVIHGFKTDVNEISVTHAAVDARKYRPLMGGTQIEINGRSGQGTLGCFAKRNTDNKIVLLSNWHVLVEGTGSIDGERVGQATHNGCCSCCACGEIADVTDGRFTTGNLDAAIALLQGQDTDTIPEARYLNEIIEIGTVCGSAIPIPGETVWKRGRTSHLTKGQISNDNATTTTIYDIYNNFPVTRTGQYQITPTAPHVDFFLKGDSGSVSVNEHHQAILLNFAFDPTTHLTYANNLRDVEAALGISILNSTFHSVGKEGVPLSSIAASQTIFNLADSMKELEAELTQSREGKRMLELFKIHRAELIDLVNNKREVMAAWNRYQGPAYLAHIARSFRRDNKPVPEQIKSITLQSLLLKMTAVLQRNGSPELAKSVTDNYLQVMNVLSAGRTPEDWRAYLAHLDQMAHA